VLREYGDTPRILCWPQQLNQVFMNLLLNARQATADGGRITITTTASSAGVEVRIRDTGTGIRPQHLARIFDPGFTTKGERIGMGLGLLISRRIVERHGGRLLAVSTPGAGAEFTVRLPFRPPDDLPDTVPPDAEVTR
jgi:signal transduction histidine kinase